MSIDSRVSEHLAGGRLSQRAATTPKEFFMVDYRLNEVFRERSTSSSIKKLLSMDMVKREKQSATVTVARVRPWTRLSPLHVFRMFRDTYVRGCVTFSNSSKVNAVAHSAAFQISCDDNSFSRATSRCVRDDIASAQELLDLSAKFSREVSEQESVQSGHKHLTALITGTNGLTMADLQGYASSSPGRSPLRKSDRVSKLKLTDIQNHSGPLRKTGASGLTLNDLQGHSGPLRARPSFDAVPECEQYTETRLSSASQLKMQDLFLTSALHPTEFLQSSSRRLAALDQLGLPPRNNGLTITRVGSERQRPHSRYASTSSLPLKPLSPLTDMSTFREQSRKSYDLPRVSSRRRERFGSMPSSASMNSSSRSVTPFDDLLRTRSGKSANRPNPYREYDTRFPSPVLTV